MRTPVRRTALNCEAFPKREQRENNPFPKEKQLIMSLIMKNLFHRNFKGKVKKDCGKMQGILEKKNEKKNITYFVVN